MVIIEDLTMYTITYEHKGDIFYLNHSTLSSLSFGSQDMAWTTDDREKAELMLFKVCSKKNETDYAEITEL